MDTVSIRYWQTVRNCGDAISSYIVRYVLGYEPRVVSSKRPHILCIGSILAKATPQSAVWGSGILNPTSELPALEPRQLYALRGKYTVQVLRDLRLALPELPLGDPGVLVRRLPQCQRWLEENQREGPLYRAAIVPHLDSFSHPSYNQFKNVDDIAIVDMRDDSLEPLRKICRSEVVLSQSLHGLIFSEALGKPTCWISEKLHDVWTFKFRDWYTNILNPPDRPIHISDLNLDTLRHAEIRDICINENDIIKAFPFNHSIGKEEIIDFEYCRSHSPDTIILPCLNISNEYEIKHDDEDGIFLKKKIGDTLRQRYSSWSERPFTLICSDEIKANALDKNKIREFMEQQKSVSMLWICRKSDLNYINQDKKIEEFSGYTLARETILNRGAVFIRPTSDSNISKKNCTLFI